MEILGPLPYPGDHSLNIWHPIFQGMNWDNFLGMTGMAIVLLVMSLIQFRFADIGLS
jgi:hypothetical protein